MRNNPKQAWCMVCEKPYTANSSQSRYCGPECRLVILKTRYRKEVSCPKCLRLRKITGVGKSKVIDCAHCAPRPLKSKKPPMECKGCGRIYQPCTKTGNGDVFCSDVCAYSRKCLLCETDFKSRDKRSRFCSGRCMAFATSRQIRRYGDSSDFLKALRREYAASRRVGDCMRINKAINKKSHGEYLNENEVRELFQII